MQPEICEHCGKPATCVGAYEGAEQESGACDDCCGHGNEDGHCRPIDEPDDEPCRACGEKYGSCSHTSV